MRCPVVASYAMIAALVHGRPPLVTALATTKLSAASAAMRAVELSNKANVDPSFAEEACALWTSVLGSQDDDSESSSSLSSTPLPAGAMPAAHALHASTLARIGRDGEAVAEYRKSLAYLKDGGALSRPATKEEVDIRTGMGRSLQRTLRYREAADAFLDAAARCLGVVVAEVAPVPPGKNEKSKKVRAAELARSESSRSAALCLARIGDVDAAVAILEECRSRSDFDSDGMLGALLLMQIQSPVSTAKGAERREMCRTAQALLRGASLGSTSPLYNWLHITSKFDRSDDVPFEPLRPDNGEAYLSFAKVNNSPFDDPDLINLDDKILLHSGVMEPCRDAKGFWPRGYVLPRELDSFSTKECNDGKGNAADESRKRWMLKERSGYGGHGNSVASADEALARYSANDSGEAPPVLCQSIVDPPMLIDSRKFSLRIYVVYFPGGRILSENGETKRADAEIYVSTEGLVKCASAPYVDGVASGDADVLNDQYMTNSGRGDGRSSEQRDLTQLRRDFETKGINYDKTWGEIEKSIWTVMKRFVQLRNEEIPTKGDDAQKDGTGSSRDSTFIRSAYTPICSIPKIMGFDYIFDSSVNPYLLEVNRFPGLEPRSSMDADVKRTVVYDTWVAACDRMGVPRRYLQDLRPYNYKGFSLKKLSLK